MEANKNMQNSPSKFFCKLCDYGCGKASCLKQHLSTAKHTRASVKLIEANKKMQNMPQNMQSKYYCNSCDYGCSKSSCWKQHLLTSKHAKHINMPNIPNKMPIYYCDKCNMQFIHQSSCCRHKKKCNIDSLNKNENNSIFDKELIMTILKQTCELHHSTIEQNNQMLEVLKTGTHNNSHNNTHSHNKTFNLQFFLNETCKNAMNITDFVNSITLQLSDIEKVGELGYVDGISNIIIKNLNDLDVTERPMHCTDAKRDTLYVKDENKWEREADEKPKIRGAIKQVSKKSFKLISEFQQKYPDCYDSDSEYNDKLNELISEVLGNTEENESKIMKKVSKQIVVDKEI